MPAAVDAESVTEGALVWAKINGEPWWPSVVFPDWEAVAKWEIPLPKTTSSVPSTHRVIYFLGPVINFAVVPAQETSIRNHALAPLDTEVPPWGGWPANGRWSRPALRAQWTEACEEAQEMLAGKDSGESSAGGRGVHEGRRGRPRVHGVGACRGRGRQKRLGRDAEEEVVEEGEPTRGSWGTGLSGKGRTARARVTQEDVTVGSRTLGQEVVGKRIEVWWDGEEQWFGGILTRFDARTHKHTVEYDDGEVIVEDLKLSKVRWPRLCSSKDIPADSSSDVDKVAADSPNTGRIQGRHTSVACPGAATADDGAQVRGRGCSGPGPLGDRYMTPSPLLPSTLSGAGLDTAVAVGGGQAASRQVTAVKAKKSMDKRREGDSGGSGRGLRAKGVREEQEGEEDSVDGARDDDGHAPAESGHWQGDDDLTALTEGTIVWAKISGDPWWPAVVFPSWTHVGRWEIPLPPSSKRAAVPAASRVVYFLGPAINFAVVPANEASIRTTSRAAFDDPEPPWGGWPATSRWAAKSANALKLREQWVEACEEARSMLDSASKLTTLRKRSLPTEKDNDAGSGEGKVAPRRTVPRRDAKAAGLGGFAVVGRRVEVWWDGDRQWFPGRIAKFTARTGRHLIAYDDGDEETVDLKRQRLRWLPVVAIGRADGVRSGGDTQVQVEGAVRKKRRKKKALFTKPKYLLKAAAAHNLSGIALKKSSEQGGGVEDVEAGDAGFVEEIAQAGAEADNGSVVVRKKRKRKALFTKRSKLKAATQNRMDDDGLDRKQQDSQCSGARKRKVLIAGVMQEVTARNKDSVTQAVLIRKKKRKALFTKKQKLRHKLRPTTEEEMVSWDENEPEQEEVDRRGQDSVDQGVERKPIKKRRGKLRKHLFTKRVSSSRAAGHAVRSAAGRGQRMGAGRGHGQQGPRVTGTNSSAENLQQSDEAAEEEQHSHSEQSSVARLQEGTLEVGAAESAPRGFAGFKRKKRKAIFTKPKKVVMKVSRAGVAPSEVSTRTGRGEGRGRTGPQGWARGAKRCRTDSHEGEAARVLPKSTRHEGGAESVKREPGGGWGDPPAIELSSELLRAASAATGALAEAHVGKAAEQACGHVGRSGRASRPTPKVDSMVDMVLGVGPRGGKCRKKSDVGLGTAGDDGSGQGGCWPVPRSLKSLSSGTVVWAKQDGFPWWPAIVFRGWAAWRRHGLPLPLPESAEELKQRAAKAELASNGICKGTMLPLPAQGYWIVHFLGPQISYALMHNDEGVLRLFTPPPSGWVPSDWRAPAIDGVREEEGDGDVAREHLTVTKAEGTELTENGSAQEVGRETCLDTAIHGQDADGPTDVGETSKRAAGEVGCSLHIGVDVAAEKRLLAMEEVSVVSVEGRDVAKEPQAAPMPVGSDVAGPEQVVPDAVVVGQEKELAGIDKGIESAAGTLTGGEEHVIETVDAGSCVEAAEVGVAEGGGVDISALTSADDLVALGDGKNAMAEVDARQAVAEKCAGSSAMNVREAEGLQTEAGVHGTMQIPEEDTQDLDLDLPGVLMAEGEAVREGIARAGQGDEDTPLEALVDDAASESLVHEQSQARSADPADDQGVGSCAEKDAQGDGGLCVAHHAEKERVGGITTKDGSNLEETRRVGGVGGGEVEMSVLRDGVADEDGQVMMKKMDVAADDLAPEAGTAPVDEHWRKNGSCGGDGEGGGENEVETGQETDKSTSSDHRVSISSLLCGPEADITATDGSGGVIDTPWGKVLTPRNTAASQASAVDGSANGRVVSDALLGMSPGVPTNQGHSACGGQASLRVNGEMALSTARRGQSEINGSRFDDGNYDFSDFFTKKHTPVTWVRTVALPVLEGQEMAADMTGTLSVQEAALRAENDPLCCGFVRQVTENVFYWKRAGSGFCRIFRQDAASVSGKWETYYIKERMDTAAEDVAQDCSEAVRAAQRAEHAAWEQHRSLCNQTVNASLRPAWKDAVARADQLYLAKLQQQTFLAH